MKVNTNSWHFQLMQKIGLVDPWHRRNLCSYMRGLMITMGMPVFLVLAPFILYMVYDIPLKDEITIDTTILIVLGLWGSVGTTLDVFIVLTTIVWFCMGFIIKYTNSLFTKIKHSFFREKKESKPNIFIEYIKANKKKICPMIEFVEE